MSSSCLPGLSFDIDNIGQSCAVRNISDPTEAKLPYDFIQGGKVHQLTADQFFYKANNTYQYLGQVTLFILFNFIMVLTE